MSDSLDYTAHIAPHKGQTLSVVTAPTRGQHHSKRFAEIEENVGKYNENREFLTGQAVHKDRIFKKNVKNLRVRIERFKGKVEVEAAARDKSNEAIKASFEEELAKVEQAFVRELETSCAQVADEWIPPQEARIKAWKEDFDHFVNVTVPQTIENQSGRVTRHLIKSQETFEIDNTKLMKREKKIVERAAEHVATTHVNMGEQERKRKACFVLLEEDMHSEVRSADRTEEQWVSHVSERVHEVQEMQGGLAGIREKTDADLLLVIEEEMNKVQQVVLTNFARTGR